MIKKITKIGLGLALVPFCLGFLWQLFSTIFSLSYRPNTPYYFAAGVISYLTVHVLFKKPILTYVFGHELTHAFFTLLFGGSVKSFHASDRGGRVVVTKSNFIITLAPYFFPIYTFGALLFYGIARSTGAGNNAINTVIFFSGAGFTFHLMLTLIFLQTDQNDIREQGALFSYPLIFLFNIIFAALLVDICLAENMNYLEFLAGGIMKAVKLTEYGFTSIFGLIEKSGAGNRL